MWGGGEGATADKDRKWTGASKTPVQQPTKAGAAASKSIHCNAMHNSIMQTTRLLHVRIKESQPGGCGNDLVQTKARVEAPFVSQSARCATP